MKKYIALILKRPIVQLSLLLVLITVMYSLYENRVKVKELVTTCVEYVEIKKEPQKFFYLLDAGHSRYNDEEIKCDSNSKAYRDNLCSFEWEINWAIRDQLAQMLNESEIQYDFVNSKNNFMSIEDRISFVNNYQNEKKLPIILISIHSNYSMNSNTTGFEIYIAPEIKDQNSDIYKNKRELSKIFAQLLLNHYKNYFPDHNVNAGATDNVLNKKRATDLIKGANTYSILVVNEFFSNPKMLSLLKTEEFQKNVATVLFRTILEMEHQIFKEILNQNEMKK